MVNEGVGDHDVNEIDVIPVLLMLRTISCCRYRVWDVMNDSIVLRDLAEVLRPEKSVGNLRGWLGTAKHVGDSE